MSYSWSSPDYSERVLAIAEHLRRDGVDVVLDRWHLREGQDAFAFMEAAVTDNSISKVLILCDPVYADKANDRAGGVGTETLIISPNVYREAKQTKFVPVIMERRDDGSVPLPVYLDGRIYIDLSNAEREDEQYERLLRVIYGKPELEPPPLGEPPSFLDDTRPALMTGRSLAQYKDAVLRDRVYQHGYLDTYLSRLSDAYAGEFIVEAKDPTDLLAKVKSSIDRFLPYRDEYIEFIEFLAKFGGGNAPSDRLHRFFEDLSALRLKQSPLQWEHAAATENLSFLVRELAIYTSAQLLRAERFETLGHVLAPIHVKSYLESGGRMRGIEVLDPPMRQLVGGGDYYRDPLAQLIDLRRHKTLSRSAWLDTELFLAIRSRFDPVMPGAHSVGSHIWWPRGITGEWHTSQSELLARLGDSTYRDRMLPTFGVATLKNLEQRLALMSDEGFTDGTLRILSTASLKSILRVG
jgi:hypothetical protein